MLFYINFFFQNKFEKKNLNKKKKIVMWEFSYTCQDLKIF